MWAAAFKLLGWRGSVGLALFAALVLLLVIQTGEKRHWKKQSDRFEQLYSDEKLALETTVANYRRAAAEAHASDLANIARVQTEAAHLNERTTNDFETRLADARARAERLRREAAAHPGSAGGTNVSGVSTAASGIAQAPGEDGLSGADRLIATEQAIELDELIRWVKGAAAIKTTPQPVAKPPARGLPGVDP